MRQHFSSSTRRFHVMGLSDFDMQMREPSAGAVRRHDAVRMSLCVYTENLQYRSLLHEAYLKSGLQRLRHELNIASVEILAEY
jgi:hypothetical protein